MQFFKSKEQKALESLKSAHQRLSKLKKIDGRKVEEMEELIASLTTDVEKFKLANAKAARNKLHFEKRKQGLIFGTSDNAKLSPAALIFMALAKASKIGMKNWNSDEMDKVFEWGDNFFNFMVEYGKVPMQPPNVQYKHLMGASVKLNIDRVWKCAKEIPGIFAEEAKTLRNAIFSSAAFDED
jgi:hypothetical protein